MLEICDIHGSQVLANKHFGINSEYISELV